jgi:hypothetical protein
MNIYNEKNNSELYNYMIETYEKEKQILIQKSFDELSGYTFKYNSSIPFEKGLYEKEIKKLNKSINELELEQKKIYCKYTDDDNYSKSDLKKLNKFYYKQRELEFKLKNNNIIFFCKNSENFEEQIKRFITKKYTIIYLDIDDILYTTGVNAIFAIDNYSRMGFGFLNPDLIYKINKEFLYLKNEL